MGHYRRHSRLSLRLTQARRALDLWPQDQAVHWTFGQGHSRGRDHPGTPARPRRNRPLDGGLQEEGLRSAQGWLRQEAQGVLRQDPAASKG